MAESYVYYSRFFVILLSLLLIASNDIEAVKSTADFCTKFSATFVNQCYHDQSCIDNCKREGFVYGGECEWKGIWHGFACMCFYYC
uniref:Defensin-like protein 19 n=1 Tax=Nicotiana tabacum TaxID=4097 RepID=A0A1S4CTE3_TOBAC|nr:PREDICTED: defensin-like protein 19 [Nicotiana tabacum]